MHIKKKHVDCALLGISAGLVALVVVLIIGSIPWWGYLVIAVLSYVYGIIGALFINRWYQNE